MKQEQALRKLIRKTLKENYTRVTADVWTKLSDGERERALHSAVKDADVEDYVQSTFEDLPPEIQSNMSLEYIKWSRALNEGKSETETKAEKILNNLVSSFGELSVDQLGTDPTYRRQAITTIIFGLMD